MSKKFDKNIIFELCLVITLFKKSLSKIRLDNFFIFSLASLKLKKKKSKNDNRLKNKKFGVL